MVILNVCCLTSSCKYFFTFIKTSVHWYIVFKPSIFGGRSMYLNGDIWLDPCLFFNNWICPWMGYCQWHFGMVQIAVSLFLWCDSLCDKGQWCILTVIQSITLWSGFNECDVWKEWDCPTQSCGASFWKSQNPPETIKPKLDLWIWLFF